MRTIDSVEKKFALARACIVKLRPYYSAAIYRMVPVATDEILTLACDRYWRCYYNPTYLESVSVLTAATDVLHELGHLLQRHENRCTVHGLEHGFFNVAGDFEINDDLREQKDLDLSKTAIHPKHYGMPVGLIAEEYYKLVMERREEFQALLDANKPGFQDCGSCSGGKGREWEYGDPSGNARGVKPHEAERVRNVVARDLLNYARKNPGSVPGDLERWADEILNPKVPWQTMLRSSVRRNYAKRAGMSDHSYRMPNRRQDFYGEVIMPALVDPSPGIAVVLDTSGSMDATLLAEVLAEVRGITRDLSPDDGVSVFCVDADATPAQQVFDPKQVKLLGGGGTDMGVGIAAAERHRPRPEICIVLTDGYTPWPKSQPSGMDVVVGIVGSKDAHVPNVANYPVSLPSGISLPQMDRGPDKPPEWATTIYIS